MILCLSHMIGFCFQRMSSITWMLLELDPLRQNNDFDCTVKCLRNPICRSINLAASKNANGKLWCELLSSDRYKNALNYKENKTSHHLFLVVRSVL